MTKIVLYKCLNYRPDGSLISDTWELTQEEYDFYKTEMPRRALAAGKGYRFEFEKIKPKTIEYAEIPGLSKLI